MKYFALITVLFFSFSMILFQGCSSKEESNEPPDSGVEGNPEVF